MVLGRLQCEVCSLQWGEAGRGGCLLLTATPASVSCNTSHRPTPGFLSLLTLSAPFLTVHFWNLSLTGWRRKQKIWGECVAMSHFAFKWGEDWGSHSRENTRRHLWEARLVAQQESRERRSTPGGKHGESPSSPVSPRYQYQTLEIFLLSELGNPKYNRQWCRSQVGQTTLLGLFYHLLLCNF